MCVYNSVSTTETGHTHTHTPSRGILSILVSEPLYWLGQPSVTVSQQAWWTMSTVQVHVACFQGVMQQNGKIHQQSVQK